MLKKWLNFFKIDIWYIKLAQASGAKRFGIRFFRVIILLSEGFSKSQIQQGANALTYYTLLAIVPIIALILAISRAFNLQKAFIHWLLNEFPNQKELFQKILKFAERSLETANQGLIAGIGVLLLLWSVFKILMYLEKAMNQIWDVSKGRSYARKFSDYLAVLFLLPILFFIAYGTGAYISNSIKDLSFEILGGMSFVVKPLLKLIPIVITGFLLTFLYIFIPNTRILFLPAFVAGLLTSLLYQIIQWVYVFFQIGVSGYNAIYGAFAALPLFLIWLHLSWVIILLGSKLGFALQTMDAYAYLLDIDTLHYRLRQLLSLNISHFCIKKFCEGKEAAPTVIDISNALSIPLTLSTQLLRQLVDAEVLSSVKRKDLDEGYQPAKDVDSLTIKAVIDMIDMRGETILLPPLPELDTLLSNLQQFDHLVEQSKANVLLKTI